MSRTRHDLEALLESVYVKCNPAKLLSTPGFVRTVLDKYDGYHDCLVMCLMFLRVRIRVVRHRPVVK